MATRPTKMLPSRADHVGSFLRPKHLADAREQWRQGKLATDQLKKIEDEAIEGVVALQEQAGLKAITDGEFRRDYWHLDFLGGFKGVEISDETYGMKFSGGSTVGTPYTAGKVGDHSGVMHDHFGFVKHATKQTAKLCIPAPGMLYLRGGRKAVNESAYPDLGQFWTDVIAAYQREVAALEGIGCTYLQFDDTSFAYLCDAGYRDQVKARGDNPDKMVEQFAKATTGAVETMRQALTVISSGSPGPVPTP